MEELLTTIGLTNQQSKAYLFLINKGSSAPKELVKELSITRTNAYKVLESLEKFGLVYKSDINKKIKYTASDPSALFTLLAEKRNQILAVEESVTKAIASLRQKYSKNSFTSVSSFGGKQAMIDAYENQASSGQPIYFIKTRADIPFMGHDMMSAIRIKQAKSVSKRHGITPDSLEAKLAPNTNLNRVWVDEADYTAPVEWSVSGDNLIIQAFEGHGGVIKIQNAAIA